MLPGQRRHIPQAVREEVERRLWAGQSIERVGRETGIGYYMAWKINQECGRPRRRRWPTNAVRVAALERIAGGETILGVARELGYSFATVWGWVQPTRARRILKEYRGRESLIRKL